MTSQTQQRGFMLSATFHGLIVALLLLWSYAASLNVRPPTRILELVRGEGNNYMATEAPALGTPGGVKVNIPKPPAPKPETPVQAAEPTPVKPEPSPVKAAPAPVAPPTKATTTKAAPTKAPRTMAQEIRRQLANADVRAKRAVAQERAEDQKRAAAAAKVQHIDAAGIRKGVEGGSTANTEGGAGGKALTATEGAAMERYESALLAALRRALEEEKPAGLSESLMTRVEFRLNADGSITNVRITKGSGAKEFDDAVRAAFRRVGSIGPRPDKKSEDLELDFRAKEEGD